MTTAHRPTFDTARGKENSSAPTRQYSSRSLPAHKKLKYRQAGQGGHAEVATSSDALKEELLAAERAHFKDKSEPSAREEAEPQRLIEAPIAKVKNEDETSETMEERRRRILEETKDIDADESDSEREEESEEESDDEDETAELMRELQKIKAERAAEAARKEAEVAAEEQAKRDQEIAFGNPLMNDASDFSLKRRWDEDVVFRVKEKDESGKKDFVNDLLRSDFHRSFMKKYVR